MDRMNHKKEEKMPGVSRMEKCPKCGFEHHPGDTECLSCGIVYKKYETYALRTKNAQEKAKKQKNAEDKNWRRKETPIKSVNTRAQLKGAAYAVCAITIFMAIYLAIFSAKAVEGNGIKLAYDATVAIKTRAECTIHI